MLNKKRVVLVVLNNFLNDSRVLKEAVSLKSHGYDAEVVALHDDGLKNEELINGIKVTRIKLVTRHISKHILVKLFKYLEFCFKALVKCRNADVIHCNDLNALPIGVLGKIFLNSGIKIVYDAHEFEPFLHGISRFETKFRIILERNLLIYVDRVITVSESIALAYENMYGIQKPDLVLNCPKYVDCKKSDLLREKLGIPLNKKIFLYQGKLSKGRGLESLILAFSQMMDSSTVLVFMGYGPLASLIEASVGVSSRIYYHPAVEPEVLLDYTASADFGVILTEDSCLNNRYSLPNKLFEYLMAGLPVICSNLPEMRRITIENSFGVVIGSFEVEEILKSFAKAVSLERNFSDLNVDEIRKKFCWEEQEKKMLAVYNGL